MPKVSTYTTADQTPRPEVRQPSVGSATKKSARQAVAKAKAQARKRVSALPARYGGDLVQYIADWLGRYLVLSPRLRQIIALWVVSSWLADNWDRFGHLAIVSPEKRCGKTLALTLISMITKGALHVSNISPAALFRLVETGEYTLLIDEAQSLTNASESSQAVREILNAAIDKNATIPRCVGPDFEPKMFKTYGPKVIARIGRLDPVLWDRCVPVELERKLAADTVERVVLRKVEKEGEEIRQLVEQWCEQHTEKVQLVYDELEPLPIANYRTADILLSLQAVATVVNPLHLNELEQYAAELERVEAETDCQSAGVLLLKACREIMDGLRFITTAKLIEHLVARAEEPWGTFNRGKPITPRGVANLLKEYKIQPAQHPERKEGKVSNKRGYHKSAFMAAWHRYCPPTPPA